MELFEIGDTVRHKHIYREHARRYFNGATSLVIRSIGREDGSMTTYAVQDSPHIVCHHRLELVERGGGPW